MELQATSFAGTCSKRESVEKRTRAPIVETLHDHWRVVAGFAGLSVYSAVTFYIGFVYLVSWQQTADGIPPSRSLEINSFSMAISLPVLIATGWLSDRIGRKPLMLLASMGGVIGALPLFFTIITRGKASVHQVS